ncbi:MAG: HAMP domain-containing sensor histidine kinase [Eubacteriales bacterium]|nr:HAMP domain-containing sensor histidine kinase [Eubacteriales bacterium]
MYRKLRFQLTAFCVLVIGVVLAAVVCISLKLFRDNQELKCFNDFQETMNRICQTLSTSESISHSWLTEVSAENDLALSILDNVLPLLYQVDSENENLDSYFLQARSVAVESYALSELSVKTSNYPKHVEFQMKTDADGVYLASVAYIPKEFGLLTVTALFDLTSHLSYLDGLYPPIVLSALGAALLLSVLSFFLIRRLIRPLEESHERQTAFFAAASHELRSPLAVILSSLSAMEAAPQGKADGFLGIVKKESLRMQRLVNDMFTLASLDNGSVSIRKEPVFLDNLLIEAYERFCGLAAQKKIRIEVRLPEEVLPEAFCDPERIAQVFTILLDNAVAYTPEGGMIWVSLEGGQSGFTVRVADNGFGVPKEQREDIFSRFYRCDQARTDKEHFGLGLSIAREIVELHGGKILVREAEGGGAEFVVTLPGVR